MNDNYCVPFVAAIIERQHNGKTELLIQTRYNPNYESIYNGTFEFAAGTLDKAYENVYEALAREIKEETGMTLKDIINDSQTKVYTPQGQDIDAVFGFKPFCCVQQLREGRPWVGFIFRCEVEDGEPRGQDGESKDVHWVGIDEVRTLFEHTPEKLFTLEVPAWAYYFQWQQAIDDKI
jgi:8-oxo-dGTP pyrophosphatase MutT (NUDIX family)